jgi:peptidoglycan/xylan/chitin deacetylase (PgdA/CDA1 family)
VSLPPVLVYHKVDPRLELGVTRLGPRHFRRQVETLAALGFRGLGAAELLDLMEGRGARSEERDGAPSLLTPRSSPLVFTFDDGYAALAEHAFPVLADHGFGALVFVITDHVGGDNRWDLRPGGRVFAHLDWDTLGRWQERGMEVHSHGTSHGRLTWMSDAQIEDELHRSRATIRARLGREASAVAYPFGAVDARVRRLAAAAGYRLGFAGPRGRADDLLSLPRLPVYPWDRSGVPLVMQAGAAGAVARWAGRTANRIAVLTSVARAVSGRP